MKKWTGKYVSDFAVQVTSNVPLAQKYTKSFSNNQLLGTSRFLEDYKSSRARIAVTVGMMTTGYDCPDLLNVVLMRPVFSPSDYVQMKGRGTRLFTFKYGVQKEKKKRFMLVDFFGNYDYFEDEFNFDDIIKLPLNPGKPKLNPPPPAGKPKIELHEYDPLKSVTETYIGNEGMKVDRMYYNRFAEDVKVDPQVKKIYAEEGIDQVEQYVRLQKMNKPADYFTLEKLWNGLGLDRRATLREILISILTGSTVANRDELIEQEINRFILSEDPSPLLAPIVRLFMESYIEDEETREIIDSGEFARLATNAHINQKDLRQLGSLRERITTYCNDYILPRHDLRPYARS